MGPKPTSEVPFIVSLHAQIPKYNLDPYLGDRYADMLSVLSDDKSSKSRLEPKKLFSELNGAIPHTATSKAVPSPKKIVELRHDLEEQEKPYFDHWAHRGSGPSAKNKEKTLTVLGREALAHSIAVNMSSVWSRTPTGRRWS